MHDRHEHYKAMGKAMKGLGDQLKSDTPSIEEIPAPCPPDRPLCAADSGLVPAWQRTGDWPGDAGQGRDLDRRRHLPPTGSTAFETAAARFNRTAQTGDLDAIRAGQGELGKACKNCHDRFRGPRARTLRIKVWTCRRGSSTGCWSC
jgi:hypothetical protein